MGVLVASLVVLAVVIIIRIERYPSTFFSPFVSHSLSQLISYFRRYIAEILPIRRKTLSTQSINNYLFSLFLCLSLNLQTSPLYFLLPRRKVLITLYCSSCSVLIILTNQMAIFMRLKVFRNL